MANPINPYVAGNPVGDSPAFIGRADVLREVLRVLRRPQDNAIVLYGQRRIGKTSILQQLATWLPHEGQYCPVYFDLQDKAALSLGKVLEVLARTIAHSLSQPAPDLSPDPEVAFREVWLPSVLTNLQNGSCLVLLFDEFDVLADPKVGQAAAAFFPYLRDLLASDRQRLKFVFAIGRNVDDLAKIALSLFKVTSTRRISLLNRNDAAELVHLSQKNDTLIWHDEAVDRVWKLTNGHPYLTQQLCSHVWEIVYDEEHTEPPAVTLANIEAAIPHALDASRNMLEWLWDGLPPAEQVVLSALTEAGPGPITQKELERLLRESGIRVVIRELQDAPKLLQDWDLIEPVEGGHRFRVELLRRWIAEYKPLCRVQEGLDRIEPAAENLYRAALELYRGGQLDQAIGLLQQAISVNPNHVRASELLADILLAQGQLTEARQLLERLYEYQPVTARSRLVQVLLAQAQIAESDDERLTLYKQVVDLEPAQPEAIAGQKRIWQQRGDNALQSDDLYAALAAYQAADLADKVVEVEQEIHRRADVFISYSHHDKDWVQNCLLPQLESANARVWIDFRDFQPGTPILSEVERAVSKSRKTLLVLTPDYLASEWTDFEHVLTQTLDPASRGQRLIPLLLKPCELPPRIRALTYLDFTDSDQVTLQLERLIAAVRSETRLIQAPKVESPARTVPTQPRRELPDLARLRQMLAKYFDESELRDLCFELSIEYDDLPGVSKGSKVREIVAYLDRRERTSELVNLVQRLRPKAPWEDTLWVTREARPKRVKARQGFFDERILKLDELRQKISDHFNEEELRTLCFDMQVDYEALPGWSKDDKVRELVSYFERHGRILELARVIQQQRPGVSWEYVGSERVLRVLRDPIWQGIGAIVGILAMIVVFLLTIPSLQLLFTTAPTPTTTPTAMPTQLPVTPYPTSRTCRTLRSTWAYPQPDETKVSGQNLDVDKSVLVTGQIGDGKWLVIQLPNYINSWYTLSADVKCSQ